MKQCTLDFRIEKDLLIRARSSVLILLLHHHFPHKTWLPLGLFLLSYTQSSVSEPWERFLFHGPACPQMQKNRESTYKDMQVSPVITGEHQCLPSSILSKCADLVSQVTDA